MIQNYLNIDPDKVSDFLFFIFDRLVCLLVYPRIGSDNLATAKTKVLLNVREKAILYYHENHVIYSAGHVGIV